jgi:glycosyltransferase involved in cell wall biosynthesis
VTIRIATKDRPDLLASRSVPAALSQTYSNIEVLVVGDNCDERTAEVLSAFDDPRLRYVNLGRQGRYPENSRDRWSVAGTKPMNAGLLLARGEWIAPCDDDDAFTADHVEKLLLHAKANELEFVWSKTLMQGESDTRVIGDGAFNGVSHGSIMYSMGLDMFAYSPYCYRLRGSLRVADQNLWFGMKRAGVRMGFLDEVTYVCWPAGAAQYTR